MIKRCIQEYFFVDWQFNDLIIKGYAIQGYIGNGYILFSYNMKWKIEKGRFDATSLMANINFELKNDALRYCLAQVRIINYPEFISLQSKSSSYGEEHVHIRNFKDMDWEDKSWAKKVKGSDFEMGEVFLIHDVMGETIIKETLFDQIIFDYGSKIMEVYENEKSLPTSWTDDMGVALRNLKQKIDNESRH